MLDIYSLCNKHCVGTIHNLSTYVCDCSWDAHKTFIHPLLFLKLGVTVSLDIKSLVRELGSGERFQLGCVIGLAVSLERLKRLGFECSIGFAARNGGFIGPLALKLTFLEQSGCEHAEKHFVDGFVSLPRCIDWGNIELPVAL